MSARDDYPLITLKFAGDTASVDARMAQHEKMCDEIDDLRATVDDDLRATVDMLRAAIRAIDAAAKEAAQ
jgi:hypothetical protein